MRGAAAVAVLLLGLAGCSGAGDLVVHRSGGSVMMASAQQPDADMLAIVAGTLTLTDHGCVALGWQGTKTPLVLPFGSTIADDGQSIDVPGVGVLRVGDEVSHGGGMGSLEDLDGVPAECGTSGTVAVWN